MQEMQRRVRDTYLPSGILHLLAEKQVQLEKEYVTVSSLPDELFGVPYRERIL